MSHKLVVWQVWCSSDAVKSDKFFVSRKAAVDHIKHRYGIIMLEADEHDWHSWSRENYPGVNYHPDGHSLWIGWTPHHTHTVHLERHDIDPTQDALVEALNSLPKRRASLHRRHDAGNQ